MTSAIEDTLRDSGLRVTRQRTTVLATLHDRSTSSTAQEMYLQLVKDGEQIGLSTVYRTLESLVEAGLIDRIHLMGETAYRSCSQRHHHHLVCTECNTVAEIHDELVEEWVGRVAETYEFQVSRHNADIFGLCSSCSAEHAKAEV